MDEKIYGYGICVSDIGEPPVWRLQALLAKAPKLQEELRARLEEDGDGMEGLEYDDYMQSCPGGCLAGLAYMIGEAAWEEKGIRFSVCPGADGHDYLLFARGLPWDIGRQGIKIEEDVENILREYVSILTDTPVDIAYHHVRLLE